MDHASSSIPQDSSRPGLTSLIRTGRGLMTVQTEIVGEPAQLVTIVDFRGRVLKSWKGPLLVAPNDPAAPSLARKWHAEIEARVRESLSRAAHKRPSGDRRRAEEEAVAHLFIAAMQAYADRDYPTARSVLEACALLLPEDPRIRTALQRLTSRRC